MQINVFRVKSGKEYLLREWGPKIKEDYTEAVESLKEESVQSEKMCLFTIGDDVYVVGVMVPEKNKTIKPHNPEREINKKHMKVLREVLGEEIKLEKIYFVEV